MLPNPLFKLNLPSILQQGNFAKTHLLKSLVELLISVSDSPNSFGGQPEPLTTCPSTSAASPAHRDPFPLCSHTRELPHLDGLIIFPPSATLFPHNVFPGLPPPSRWSSVSIFLTPQFSLHRIPSTPQQFSSHASLSRTSFMHLMGCIQVAVCT